LPSFHLPIKVVPCNEETPNPSGSPFFISPSYFSCAASSPNVFHIFPEEVSHWNNIPVCCANRAELKIRQDKGKRQFLIESCPCRSLRLLTFCSFQNLSNNFSVDVEYCSIPSYIFLPFSGKPVSIRKSECTLAISHSVLPFTNILSSV